MLAESSVPAQKMSVTADSLVPLAREALAETPLYIEHICAVMGQCAHELRAGRDQSGMSIFARGTTDLANFVQLVDQLADVANAGQEIHISKFKTSLHHCVQQMEYAMHEQDFITLSDRIEDTLSPLLLTWSGAAGELEEGIDARAS